MIGSWSLLFISLAYFIVLLVVATQGDRHLSGRNSPRFQHVQAIIYSLSLGIFLTSWTFYGSVGRASTSGWDFIAPYIGPIVFFLFGHRVLYKIVVIAKRENISTIADFISSRHGKSRRLAVLVTLMATLGLLPYIALQLKAIDLSFAVLSNSPLAEMRQANLSVLIIALLIGVFSILFGARRVDTSAHNPGMILAIALESMLKLTAFLAVGIFAVYFINDGFFDIIGQVRLAEHPGLTDFSPWRTSFLVEVLLGFTAIICLPRQFHVTVVENNNPDHLHTARWLFPLYMTLFCVFMVPIAWAGHLTLSHTGINADIYSLLMPLAKGQNNLAVFAYIGGISAAMSMAAISTVAISTMITNDIIMPFILHVKAIDVSQNRELGRLLLNLRRLTIFAILLLSYGYYLLIDQGTTLVSIGLAAFVAVAQFAPPLLIGLYWRRGHVRGATAGLAGGFFIWAYCILLPNLTGLFHYSGDIINTGPFGISWLRPTALFGLDLDPISHATIISLSLNITLYILVSMVNRPRLIDRMQADNFINVDAHPTLMASRSIQAHNTVADVQALLERFLGYRYTMESINQLAIRYPDLDLKRDAAVNPELLRHTERTLAGIIGASSARIIVQSSLGGKSVQLGDVVSIVDEATKAVTFNRSLLQATIDNVSQGITVIDKNHKLEMWNQRYLAMFDLPEDIIAVGTPVQDIIRISAQQGEYGELDPEQIVKQRAAMIMRGEQHRSIRYRTDGTVIEVHGHTMPGGGYVNTYSDITEYHQAETALKEREKQLQQANETLEKRVIERTETLEQVNQELTAAKAKAEAIHEGKTRFLAAASHDLMQPLNAAKLFASAIAERQQELLTDAQLGQLSANLESSLSSAEELIRSLIEISKLDAGNLKPRRQHFCVADLLKVLNQEFEALCAEKPLGFHQVSSQATLYTDPIMLRRVLQNFLTNAIRYTDHGRVLLGCRRHTDAMEIQVWDTGYGVPQERLEDIFEEFQRIETGAHSQTTGIGLGLAIAQRTAHTLGHPIRVHSVLGKGSMFAIRVPIGNNDAVARLQPGPDVIAHNSLQHTRLLVIDNDTSILEGMTALLSQWGCRVHTATSAAQAIAILDQLAHHQQPQLILADYHLDGGLLGTTAVHQIRQYMGHKLAAIIITADRTNAMKKEVREAGFGLMHKPLRPAVLRKMISKYIKVNNTPN
jgi:Na+/proline symporter/signal transduction histidine kinase